MSDPLEDALRAALAKLDETPPDVVPRGDGQPTSFTPGTEVTVTWPGKDIETPAGDLIGMHQNETYDMTVTDDGRSFVGWVAPDHSEDHNPHD